MRAEASIAMGTILNIVSYLVNMEKTVKVPIDLVQKLYEIQKTTSSIIETLEELLDRESLERIKRGMSEIEKGEFIKAELGDIPS